MKEPASGDAHEVSPDLRSFLAARDLDVLHEAFAALGEITPADRRAIADVVAAGSDDQAIANLLMHPSLIPHERRLAALSAALDANGDPNRALSATVGVQTLDVGSLTTSQRARIVSALVALIATGNALVAARAAGAVGRYMRADQASRLVGSLDRPEALVRHNVLAALIEVLGPGAVSDVIADAGDLPAAARSYVAEQLSTEHGFNEDGTVDPAMLLVSGIAAPLLVHLPNLDEAGIEKWSAS